MTLSFKKKNQVEPNRTAEYQEKDIMLIIDNFIIIISKLIKLKHICFVNISWFRFRHASQLLLQFHESYALMIAYHLKFLYCRGQKKLHKVAFILRNEIQLQ
jgi:hypothetical protein